jgi:hypothetical protein
VKRALFGPTDHEENLRFASQELKRHRDEAANRWNFNFETGRPLKGRYAWKEEAVPLLGGGHAAALASGGGGVLVRHPIAAASDPDENRENVPRLLPPLLPSAASSFSSSGGSSLAATTATMVLPGGGSSFDHTASTAPPMSSLLAGSPAGCLEDLRTPAPQIVPANTSPPPAGGHVVSAAVPQDSAAAARLSDTASSCESQCGGARPKTKEQKITGTVVPVYCSLPVSVLWIRIRKDPKLFAGSGSLTRGYGSGFVSETGL